MQNNHLQWTNDKLTEVDNICNKLFKFIYIIRELSTVIKDLKKCNSMSYSLEGKKHSYHDTHLSTLDKTVKY